MLQTKVNESFTISKYFYVKKLIASHILKKKLACKIYSNLPMAITRIFGGETVSSRAEFPWMVSKI